MAQREDYKLQNVIFVVYSLITISDLYCIGVTRYVYIIMQALIVIVGKTPTQETKKDEYESIELHRGKGTQICMIL